MARESTAKTIILDYGNPTAQIMLWQKALMLIPLWAILIVPVIGLIFKSFGSAALAVGQALILSTSAAYFFQDVLKRKIRMDDEFIYFGYRAYPISDIASIDASYSKRSLLPKKLTLTFNSAKSLTFNVNGFTAESLESLVRHLQSRNSNLKTAPVISTLIKCKRVNRKPVVETESTLALPYHNKQLFEESYEAFRSSAGQWIRLGPIITLIAASPIWLAFVSFLYVCLDPNAIFHFQSLNGTQFISQLFSGMYYWIGHLINDFGENIWNITESPALAIATGSCVSAMVALTTQKFFLQPNLLLADRDGIKILLKLGECAIPFRTIEWRSIESARLIMQRQNSLARERTWTLQLEGRNKKAFDVPLSALASDDRAKLLKRIETEAPNCIIETDVAQAMLPKAQHSYTELWLQSLSQPPERKTLEPLEPGQLVGDSRFEIIKQLGVGGQGTAYLCRTLDGSENTVVLKEMIMPIFVQQSVKRTALEKFEQEAKLLQTIDDPQIVKLLDCFIEDHRSYLVLEHINGMSLRESVLQNGPLSENEVIRLAKQMCTILGVLHQHGIVHRDFTPDNLLINSDGVLKLIDFNVAQHSQSGTTGTIVGKHAYLPPEQFRGKATAQSDIYAMGATLHFLLTGQDPEPISQSSPAALKAGMNPALDELVRRATALQCNKRFATFADVESALADLDNGARQCESTISSGAIIHG